MLATPHPRALRYPLQDLVKSWVSCQAHTQTSRVNIMKWLFLQLLALCCLVISPVAGGFHEKSETAVEPQTYTKPTPELLRCVETPSYYDCKKECEKYSDCGAEYECCYAACGKICMKITNSRTSNENSAPRKASSPENEEQTPEGDQNNTA
uniref:WAP domain-containing protein n=1 Tax=Suricata suricatta TaxID=37032 RepID=A0A673V0W4_SURSU